MDRKVLLITMGGTIAGNIATAKKEGEFIKGQNEFSIILADTCNSIENRYGINVIIDHFPLCDIDSSDMLPEQWIALSKKIKEEYDNFDAFIVTHGTNTMSYTAAALSFSFANLDKPVIMTGSQVPAGMPGSDSIMNLENALRVAAIYRTDKEQIKGVIVVFGSLIISGTRLKKSTEFDYDTFVSFGSSSIGRIGRIIDIDDNKGAYSGPAYLRCGNEKNSARQTHYH